MKARLLPVALSAFLVVSAATATAAYAAQDQAEAATRVDEVVVAARRAGAPMWTVRRDGEGVMILVGAIEEAPRGFEWRAQALEDAAARSDRILFPQRGRASPADVLRLIWRIRTIGWLPQGATTADYLSAEDQARLDVLMAGEKNDQWRRYSMLMLAIDLIQGKAGEKDARPVGAADAVRRAARKARVPIRSIGVVRGADVVESLITAPPETHRECLRAAMSAAELGPDAVRLRAEAWRGLRVAEALASPVDQAVDRCWPWGDPQIGQQLRMEWTDAVAQALTQPGLSLAVAPLRTLAEPGGVLDALEAQGFELDGPEWKPATHEGG
ncbi:TraB/GumN family protein [Brevundimonas naejangsanensis]|uniref:TraB/GumN family protein n=1 Tax=Brevundimonas naejangsanensis TaxID=588932 RepID=A0A494RN74_9CAUL|nr:TraB/GumN family protein [Brevundimonas naejangsanensis]AYG95104.1 TraB/GumN family protein [Brevundimonas naejangsanensis]